MKLSGVEPFKNDFPIENEKDENYGPWFRPICKISDFFNLMHIYPMYDFSHPIADVIEGISLSLCTLEFEDHKPFYDWTLDYSKPALVKLNLVA